ncbi:ABC transporter ATP-binding protein [Phytoactinopolyspora alkaliphila]|uniref:ABC transporter ATP-binding protein n=1 Tax=Phytoactinopolyspora alkaliphila TaxID=1783498 RepID=A0A6N9YN22_9ACTN|nr:ABC transporter ATP-binding protein [Phytoactinopolyspora alkaliphila]NED96372.1 ABC transporter ATP-binding protein [Phytoactinopolyspora alkaliphila]
MDISSEPQTPDRADTRLGAPLLSVRDLTTRLAVESGVVQAVRGVSWDIYPGEILGIVGESGSGKSVSVSSLLRLLPSPPAIVSGSVMYNGQDLLTLPERRMRRIRGQEISMIFQDPMTSFNPVKTIGSQISEAIRVHHRSVSRRAARARAIELLGMVGVPSPEGRYKQFPHEYSGGMRQRAMIAMAMANQPKLIIADEPTTALDVTIQAQVLEILQLAQRETNAAIVLITHDLGLIAELADRVLVMYAGKVVESAPVMELFRQPRHPYTLSLLGSLPRLDVELDHLVSIPGQPPSLTNPPPGCAFYLRCKMSDGRERCWQEEPALLSIGAGPRSAACHFSDEMDGLAQSVTETTGVDVRAGKE